MSFEEAAALPCAGVTAWHALFEAASVQPGDTVLLQGTGGVSVFALQLAKAAGARTIITSSSADKRDRARELGADHVLDYRTDPTWGESAKALTGGEGVDLVVDVGGSGTLEQSIAAARFGGTISILGVLTGPKAELNPDADADIELIRAAGHSNITRRSYGFANPSSVIALIQLCFSFRCAEMGGLSERSQGSARAANRRAMCSDSACAERFGLFARPRCATCGLRDEQKIPRQFPPRSGAAMVLPTRTSYGIPLRERTSY